MRSISSVCGESPLVGHERGGWRGWYGEEEEGIKPEQEDEMDSSSGVAGEDDKMDEEDKGMT